jgi:hypothetical protein
MRHALNKGCMACGLYEHTWQTACCSCRPTCFFLRFVHLAAAWFADPQAKRGITMYCVNLCIMQQRCCSAPRTIGYQGQAVARAMGTTEHLRLDTRQSSRFSRPACAVAIINAIGARQTLVQSHSRAPMASATDVAAACFRGHGGGGWGCRSLFSGCGEPVLPATHSRVLTPVALTSGECERCMGE